MNRQISIYRQGFALAFGLFIYLLCVFTLEKTGVPRVYSIALTASGLMVLWIIAAAWGGTTRSTKYFHADRAVRSTVNSLAMTSILAFPVITATGGGLIYGNPAFLIAMVIGTTIGVAFSAVLISRRFHDSGAGDVSSLLNQRYSSPIVARSVSIALMLAGLGLALVGMEIAMLFTSWFFMIPPTNALFVIFGATLLTAILGGARSGTRFAGVSAVLVLLGLNLPLVIQSMSANGFPFGHLSFGANALLEMWDLEDQLRSLGIPVLKDVVTAGTSLVEWSGGQLVATGLVVAMAVAFFPALINQYALAPASESASRAATKLILFTALGGLSLIALMFFTQYNLYQTLLGLSLSEARIAAPFLFSWSGRSVDLVVLCGNVIGQSADLLTACEDGADHVLGIQDLILNRDLLIAAAPDLAGLPFAFTALLTSGLIMILVSFSAMVLLATANNLVNAFFSAITVNVISARVFFSRVAMILLAMLATFAVHFYHIDHLAMFLLSLSVMASVSAPAVLGALWFRNTGGNAIVTAASVGFVVTILYYILAKSGIDFVPATQDELQFSLPGMTVPIAPELAAIYGVPAAFFILLCNTAYAEITKVRQDSAA